MASTVVYAQSPPAASTGTTSQVCVYPDGYVAVADDLALLHVIQTNGNSAVTTPAGYTLILRTQRTTTHVDHLYRRKLGAGTGVPTVVAAVSCGLSCTITIVRGVDTTTALDVAAVSNTGTSLSSHQGPDVGVLVTPAAMVMTFVSADHTANIYGIDLWDDTTISPFTAAGGQSIYTAGGGSQTAARAITFHHVQVPAQTTWARYHSYRPNQANLTAAGWIATAIALRPADPTTLPVTRDLRAAVRQQVFTTWGIQCSPQDTHQTRISFQIFDPYDGGDNDVWSSGADGAFWDLGQWSGPGRWTDATSRVRGLEWTLGVDQPGGRPRVGTMNVDLNNSDGLLSPWATTGAYTNGGESWLRSGALMRLQRTQDTAPPLSLSIFTGIIENVDEHSQGMSDAWVSVTLVEPISVLAAHNGIEQIEQGGGETIYTRIFRLLDDADFPYGLWQGGIGVGVPVYATTATFAGTVMAGERLGELYLVGDSAGVAIYGYLDGGIVVNNPSDTAPTRTFSNKPSGGELRMAGATPYANNSRMLNAVIAARVDGHEIEIDDGYSVSKYGRISQGNGWPRRDLICQSDTTVASIVNDVLAFRARDATGVAQIEVDGDMDPNLFADLANIRLFHNVDVHWYHPVTQTLSFTQHSYVEGLHHTVTKVGHQLKWIAQYNLARFP